MRNFLFITIMVVLASPIGCATLIDIGESACEAALGGSKAGEACKEIDRLRAEETVNEVVEVSE